jgi:hypothetical protein
MYRKGKLMTNVIVGSLVVVLAAFAIGFSYLMLKAFLITDTGVGLNMSFTGYEYISIEVTFVGVILGAGYYVVSNGLRRRTIEITVEDS